MRIKIKNKDGYIILHVLQVSVIHNCVHLDTFNGLHRVEYTLKYSTSQEANKVGGYLFETGFYDTTNDHDVAVSIPAQKTAKERENT